MKMNEKMYALKNFLIFEGVSWFGMDGLSLKNFMLEFVKVA